MEPNGTTLHLQDIIRWSLPEANRGGKREDMHVMLGCILHDLRYSFTDRGGIG